MIPIKMATTHTINADKWILNYHAYLKNYTKTRIKNPLDVEEVVSDTFLAALKAKDKFQHKCSERTWLTAILRHKIIDYYRMQSSLTGKMNRYAISHEAHQDTYNYTAAIVDCDETTLSNINLKGLEVALEESLTQMTQKQSKVAKMRIYEELSTEEICARLDISRNNAWVLMSRARKAIAATLNQYDYAV